MHSAVTPAVQTVLPPPSLLFLSCVLFLLLGAPGMLRGTRKKCERGEKRLLSRFFCRRHRSKRRPKQTLPSTLPSFITGSMDTEDGDFAICGDGGSAADVAFDTVVGVIEDFMVSFDKEQVWSLVPPLHSTSSEHEQHAHYQAVLKAVEEEMDAYVLQRCSEYSSIGAIGELLQQRQEDISEEVWEFISEGCFDYETFIELWRLKKP
jgi:hypothetical protein